MAVLLYHGGVDWMRGGYLGVDAFFVLSGFLITALLLSEWRTSGGIGFASFWVRRARRLLPALALVLGGVILYGAFLAPAHQLAALRSDVLSTLGYATNWRLIFSGQGYFEQFAVPSPLRHAWSLAIEEQFYLLWPLVVYALCRWARLSWRAMAVLFAALAVAAAGWMAFLFSTAGVSRAYYGTDTRAQALLVGAALAVVYVARGTIRHAFVGRVLGIASLAAVGVTAWLWTTAGEESGWLYEGGFLLAAIAIAAVVARVVQPRSGILGSALSARPIRWIGSISYGLYLWHWPIYVVLTTDRTGLDGTPLLLARLAVTFAVAAASYYLVELPIRNGALRNRRSLVVVPAATCALLAGVLVVTSSARPVIASGDAERAALADVRAANRAAEHALATQARATIAARPLRVLVLGDSVALTLGLGLQELGAEQNLIAVNKSKMGCGITHEGDVWVGGTIEAVRGDCGDWALRWPAARAELDPDIAVLLLGAWDAYDRRLDDAWIPFGSPESDELVMRDLRGAVDVLAHDGTKVVFATVPYFENRFVVNRPDEFRSSFDPWRVDHFNELIRSVARTDPDRVAVVDLNRYLSPDGQFHGEVAGQVIQDDGMHFGVEGRKAVAAWVAPHLQRIARGR